MRRHYTAISLEIDVISEFAHIMVSENQLCNVSTFGRKPIVR